VIRYGSLTKAQLEALIDAHDAGWRIKARERTRAIVETGAFEEASSIWGDIKPVFMVLQHYKCVFCERMLGGALAGSTEHDVEHYRPKSAVRAWPYSSRKPKLSYNFPTGGAFTAGYYWLAYEPENYAAACKPCNTARKSSYFPILGLRGAPHDDVASLNAAETPLLLFPHGPNGDDPSDYITFEGIVAIPRHVSGVMHQRAAVTIDFFSLNDREEILADRFRTIREIFLALECSATNPDPQRRAQALVEIDDMTSDGAPQAACARAYLALASSDATKAWTIFIDARNYLKRS
jgi:hypothetical protein